MAKEKKECEHKWKALGIDSNYGIKPRGGGYVDDYFYHTMAAIFCERCGEIKSKEIK